MILAEWEHAMAVTGSIHTSARGTKRVVEL